MKKFIFLMFAVFLFQKFYQAETAVPISSGQHEDVILYATTWCGYCKRTRAFLAENNIQYIEYDIERSAIGKQQHDALGGGGVPVIDIKGTVVRGYSVRKMTALFKAHALM